MAGPGTDPNAAGLVFWFDFASSYSYLSAMRIEAAARKADVAIVWRPFLLGPIFNAQGWATSPFNIYPAKGAYMWRDLARRCGARAKPWQNARMRSMMRQGLSLNACTRKVVTHFPGRKRPGRQ